MECAICLENIIKEYDDQVLLVCHHIFHRYCFINYIKSVVKTHKMQDVRRKLQAKCPLCRQYLKKTQLCQILECYITRMQVTYSIYSHQLAFSRTKKTLWKMNELESILEKTNDNMSELHSLLLYIKYIK